MGKVGAITMDNVPANDKMLVTLSRMMRRNNHFQNAAYHPKQNRIRCLPHIIHLCVLEILDNLGDNRLDAGTEDEVDPSLDTEDTEEGATDIELSDNMDGTGNVINE